MRRLRPDRERSPAGYYLFGVMRARGGRGGEGEDILRVRYRDLCALVRSVPYELPPLDRARILEHQRTVEVWMRRGTILPAPYGVVFRGRRPLVRFLEDQYLVLDEALVFLEDHWEFRLHVSLASALEPTPELQEMATHLYSELRRFARAAVPFPRTERRLLSAAFLVERTAWIEFVERVEGVSAAHPELGVDVTGPWPPYDFVKMVQ